MLSAGDCAQHIPRTVQPGPVEGGIHGKQVAVGPASVVAAVAPAACELCGVMAVPKQPGEIVEADEGVYIGLSRAT